MHVKRYLPFIVLLPIALILFSHSLHPTTAWGFAMYYFVYGLTLVTLALLGLSCYKMTLLDRKINLSPRLDRAFQIMQVGVSLTYCLLGGFMLGILIARSFSNPFWSIFTYMAIISVIIWLFIILASAYTFKLTIVYRPFIFALLLMALYMGGLTYVASNGNYYATLFCVIAILSILTSLALIFAAFGPLPALPRGKLVMPNKVSLPWIGIRAWNVYTVYDEALGNREYLLGSLNMTQHLFRGRVQVASCKKCQPLPSLKCTCGLYAAFDLIVAEDYGAKLSPNKDIIVGAVKAGGLAIEHPGEGFRCASQTIIALLDRSLENEPDIISQHYAQVLGVPCLKKEQFLAFLPEHGSVASLPQESDNQVLLQPNLPSTSL